MENSYLQRINRYPTTLVQAYNDLNNYQLDAQFLSHNSQANNGIAFNTLDTLEETASVDDESLTISTFTTQGQLCGGGRGGQSSWTGRGRGCGVDTQNQTISSSHGVNAQSRKTDVSHYSVSDVINLVIMHLAAVQFLMMRSCKYRLLLIQLNSLGDQMMNWIMFNSA